MTEKPEQTSTYSPPSRDEMIQRVETAMNKALEKVESGRIYNPETSRVRIKWIKAVGYLANSYRQLKKDSDMERIEERLEALEKVQEEKK